MLNFFLRQPRFLRSGSLNLRLMMSFKLPSGCSFFKRVALARAKKDQDRDEKQREFHGERRMLKRKTWKF